MSIMSMSHENEQNYEEEAGSPPKNTGPGGIERGTPLRERKIRHRNKPSREHSKPKLGELKQPEGYLIQ